MGLTLNISKNFNLTVGELFPGFNWTSDQIKKGNDLIVKLTEYSCGEIVEDYNVSEKRVREYRMDLIHKALDQRVRSYINTLNLNGTSSHKKSAVGLFSQVYDPLIATPTFTNYTENYLKKGVCFTGSIPGPLSVEEIILNELENTVETLKENLDYPLPLVTLSSEIRNHFSSKSNVEKIQSFKNLEGKLLISKAYHNELVELIENAKTSIDITMFYINISDDVKNPINKILQKLLAAKQRGVTVRVILDKDRESDVYNSRLINKKAFSFFEKNHIQVKWDSITYLTHSKVIIFDNDYVLMGSHNWTLSSLFSYDETSILLKGSALAGFYTHSFEQIFNK